MQDFSRTFEPTARLQGTIRAPGDKSISHRALILSALAIGESTVSGLLEAEDVMATAGALAAMGASIDRSQDAWRIDGVGVGGLLQPAGALEMGNAGTATRLLMGLAASHAITASFTGDISLSRRPMDRVIEPLRRMGADFTASPGGRLPLMVRGLAPAVPITYRLPLPSAQVKSAVLLAGLNTPGVTTVIEPEATRDHSERMLAGFGAAIEIGEEDGARIIALAGERDLQPQRLTVPGDPSSAAFPLVAALLAPGSEVAVENVGINPTRAGLFEVLAEMGADIAFEAPREAGGEPVADIRARHSPLKGIEVPPEIAPRMIDEYPILFVAAALAEGRTVARGIGELRHKESDRLATMAAGLEALGVPIERFEDGLAIEGSGGEPLGGTAIADCAADGDHRIAMSMAIAGLVSRAGTRIDDMRSVTTSYPGFAADLAALGAAA